MTTLSRTRLLLNADPLSNEETSFALVFSEEAPRLCQLFPNGDLPLCEGDDIDYKEVEIGNQDEAELDQPISEAIKPSSEHLPNRLRDYFRAMIMEFKDVFRIRLGADHPVDGLQIEIKFEKKDRPVKVRQRTYSPEQFDFMKNNATSLWTWDTSTATSPRSGHVLLYSCPRKSLGRFASPSISVR